jgi:N-acetylneuraminic acid mutarotase
MRKTLIFVFLLLGSTTALGDDEKKLPPMPAAVSSNAVASLKDGLELYSMMGVGPRKTWDDVTNQVYVLHLASGRWSEGRPVPGVVGRLGASAAGAKGLIVLMGGYVVDAQGAELTLPDVNVYQPTAHKWSRGKDIPVAVDTAVAGVTHDRFVYLIGGRSPDGPVNNVQVYDVEKDAWTQGTPFPGTPVFGLAGGVAGDTIVVIDGAQKSSEGGPRYAACEQGWLGKIDHKDPNKIEWSRLPPHPGTAHFGMAGGSSDRYHKIVFSGGTSVPHDYKGAGYDGKPAEVSEYTFAYDLHGHKWETISATTYDPRADSRGVLDTPLGPLVLGGMVKNLAVTARVTLLPKK